jgi:hypothetical protein
MTQAPGSAAKAPPQRQEPRVFFFDDGRHAAGLYQFEPPLTPADHAYTVEQLVNSSVDTYIYGATLEGGVVQYDSKVAQRWGDNVKVWTHVVWYRAARVLHQLIADGHDPLQLLIDGCHRHRMLFLASVCIALQGGDRAVHGGLGRKSDWVYAHPEFAVGDDPDPRAKTLPPTRFNFLHAEVREERSRVIEELLARYETDGIELDLAEDVFPAPYCRFDEVGRLAPVLTEWLGAIRAMARKAEQAQGRAKRIYARVPAHPETWQTIGYDVPAWISGKLIDGLICTSSDDERMDQDLVLEPVVRLARSGGVRVLASFSSTLNRQLRRYATPEMVWAAAANAYDQGVDGFGLGDAHWTPNGWPWERDEYQTLRRLSDPALLATADKHYHPRSDTVPGKTQVWLPGGSRPLPRVLTPGQSAEVPLRVADDLPRWHSLGRVKAVDLKLRFTNFQPSADRVRVELNGRELPESTLEKNDLTYRLIGVGAASPYGYILNYHLGPEHFPERGRNHVKVTLLARDPVLNLPFGLHDVDCSIRYRLHRNFQREAIDY